MQKNNSITYNSILYFWLNSKSNIKIQSKLNYEHLIFLYLKDNIGNIIMNKITKEDINLFFISLKDKIAISTQKKLLYIIKSSLSYAYNNKYCDYIDLSDIKFKLPKKTMFILSREEQTILESTLKEKINIRKVCLLLCLYTGLRVGEVCGLKWEDIDFSNKPLIIKRTIQRINNMNCNIKNKTVLMESTPKSETSKRIIPIPNFIIDILKEFQQKDSYFLLSNSEKLYDPRYLESFYSRTLKKCNIKNNKFHTLRHTFATRSIESKMDIKTLSEILGHSSVEITLKLYVHPTYEMKRTSIENLVEFMAI